MLYSVKSNTKCRTKRRNKMKDSAKGPDIAFILQNSFLFMKKTAIPKQINAINTILSNAATYLNQYSLKI